VFVAYLFSLYKAKVIFITVILYGC